jgi:FMN phosphatase YigB (HAD superfamily)
MLEAGTADSVVILLDVDNTLLDNDRFIAELGDRLTQLFGVVGRDRYWAIFAELRNELGYADYLTTLQKFRSGLEDDPHLLLMSQFMLEYPFAERFYPGALETVAHLHRYGQPVVLSDGDIVFQPRKIQRSGIWDAVDGRVIVGVHKERSLDAMRRRFPATHYVMVDDKPLLLVAMKRLLGRELTTVFVRQGHYASEARGKTFDPAPDLCIDCIADLLDHDIPGVPPARVMPPRTGLAATPMKEAT